jgi:hypothetical protein
MKDELDEKLVNAHPLLYRDRSKSMMETCMYWGFECGDGWFDLIWDLSQKLERLIQKVKEASPTVDVNYLPAASQVKEKFGGLRFYMTTETDEMSEAIRKAEERSYTTCELCGKVGQLANTSWMVVRCKEHWPKDAGMTYDDAEKARNERNNDDDCC